MDVFDSIKYANILAIAILVGHFEGLGSNFPDYDDEMKALDVLSLNTNTLQIRFYISSSISL
tara:strand:- start:118 stop:303 length:186 start_codon:yes stop_codon:yes gene_type:complete